MSHVEEVFGDTPGWRTLGQAQYQHHGHGVEVKLSNTVRAASGCVPEPIGSQSPLGTRRRDAGEIAAGNDAAANEAWHDRRMRPTVLIVDDHEAFRASAATLLEAAGFPIVGEAADGRSAIAHAERLRPGIVLLDIQLPDMDGFTVAERLSGLPGPPRVVLISSRDAAAYGPRLEAAGALGFIAKRDLSGRTLAALVG